MNAEIERLNRLKDSVADVIVQRCALKNRLKVLNKWAAENGASSDHINRLAALTMDVQLEEQQLSATYNQVALELSFYKTFQGEK